MAKRRLKESKLGRAGKAVPWMTLAQAGAILGKRWASLSAKERARLSELVRTSRGRVSNLSIKERLELRKLAGKLDLPGMARDVTGLLRGKRSGASRRRRR